MDQNQKPPESTNATPTPVTPPAAPETPATPPAQPEHPAEVPAAPATPTAVTPSPVAEQPTTTPASPAPANANNPQEGIAADHSKLTLSEQQPGQPAVSSGSTPPPIDKPQDARKNKSKTMIYAVGTLIVVVIIAAALTLMNSTPSTQPAVNKTAAVQPTEPAPTDVPTLAPSPASAEAEIDSVNTTENGDDLSPVEKDINSL